MKGIIHERRPARMYAFIVIVRRNQRYAMSLAMTKAAAAASPPTRAVWNALRPGIVPVKRPLIYPNTVSATRVTTTEISNAVWARAETIYGASGMIPPPT